MHILLVADGRSPITRRWIQVLQKMQHHVSLMSTFPCTAPTGIETFHILPVAFAGYGGSQVSGQSGNSNLKSRATRMVARFRPILQPMRHILGPITIPLHVGRFRTLIKDCQPDLVHALRIPYEGMLASYTPPEIPLVISVWGNDLTLHAPASGHMGSLTRCTLRRADGLIVDATRDLRLSRMWGFSPDHPTLVVPTCGGIDLAEMERLQQVEPVKRYEELPEGIPLIINPRGLRPGYVRNDTFFQAIPLLLERQENVLFVCPSMAGQPEAMQWTQRMKIENHVHLMPYLSQTELWNLFKRARLSVSITTHDGVPNTLLEAMTLGCFPIAGDIESLREWIIPGMNGMLVDPDRPQDLAEALVLALSQPELRQRAAIINKEIIRERAEVNRIREKTQDFYQCVIADFQRTANPA